MQPKIHSMVRPHFEVRYILDRAPASSGMHPIELECVRITHSRALREGVPTGTQHRIHTPILGSHHVIHTMVLRPRSIMLVNLARFPSSATLKWSRSRLAASLCERTPDPARSCRDGQTARSELFQLLGWRRANSFRSTRTSTTAAARHHLPKQQQTEKLIAPQRTSQNG